MKIIDNSSNQSTQANYTVSADESELAHAREAVLKELAKSIKISGFRQGKAPLEIVEKNADSSIVQSEVANHVINDLYNDSLSQINIIPVGKPNITLTKFVPFSALEFKVEVEIVGNLKLGEYKSLKPKLNSYPVSDKQLDDTLKELQKRATEYSKVQRPAKIDDRLNIDFTGSDANSNLKLEKASATNFLLVIGSKTFIPGFEEKLAGKKAGEEVSFDLVFPDDYFDAEYKSRKVHFKVKINSVEAPSIPKLDDKLAEKIGPFKSLTELKSQIKAELQRENDRRARVEQDNAILEQLSGKLEADLPDILINEEVESIKKFDQQSALNAGLTWKEFLAKEKLTEATYDKKIKTLALSRIKIGLAIIEIAKQENISVSNEEITDQINLLKRQYPDPQMQAELNSTAVKNDITKRILTQKVIDHIKQLS